MNINATTSVIELERVIRNPKCNIRHLEDVLPYLSNDLKKNYALVYRSQSLQGPHTIDYENPRAILHSVEGPIENQKGLFLSFNGHNRDANFNNLEILEVDSSSEQIFRYYDIEFPPKPNSGEISWQQAQGHLKISNANPNKCQACHGNPARPIWPSYPEWPGMFGSFHIVGIPDAEKGGYDKYLEKSKDHPRYSHLVPNSDLLLASMNNRINIILNSLNMYRAIRDLKNTPQFEAFSPALALASFNECGKEYLNRAIPINIRNQLDDSFEQRFRLSEKIGPAEKSIALQSFHDPNQNYFWSSEASDFAPNHDSYFADQPMLGLIWLDTLMRQGSHRRDYASAKVRYLVEGRGLSMKGWFLDIKEDNYRWADGSTWGGGFGRALLDQDGSLKSLGITKNQYNYYVVNSTVCEKLANESEKRLSNIANVIFLPQDPDEEYSLPENYPITFINTCARCHSAGADIAPLIPYDQPKAMSNWLSDPNHRNKIRTRLTTENILERMPPTRDLDPKELGEILDYIKMFD